MESFLINLPKIELHAHLNGSLSDETLNKLVELRKSSQPDFVAPDLKHLNQFRSLSECFDVFKLAHDLVDCVDAVKIALENVIREFSEENVIYLELRSTPRETAKMTKSEYLETVCETMLSCQSKYPNIIVKFIPSINISYGVNEATSNFELFTKLRERHSNIVVGVDLSGDSTKGKFADYKHIFEKARNEGFGLAIHCAEVEDDEEILERLEFMESRDRIGHGTFIRQHHEKVWKIFIEKKIPVEICLTSNVLCGTEESYEDHNIRRLLVAEHPLTICTDDYGVFKTSLTRELGICCETYGLSKKQMLHICKTANRISFASNGEREMINKKLNEFEQSLTGDLN